MRLKDIYVVYLFYTMHITFLKGHGDRQGENQRVKKYYRRFYAYVCLPIIVLHAIRAVAESVD